ncbi:hypothetical protein [Streptomyces sp. NPDC096013]|uniref:hypothetical protein n=1 Tax=Streptomyces sp. NPDC096013 TaxID=3366069 RepID=UPI00382F08FF
MSSRLSPAETLPPLPPPCHAHLAGRCGADIGRLGNPAHDTADFSDTTPGNLPAHHVLPSKGLLPGRNGVFRPA